MQLLLSSAPPKKQHRRMPPVVSGKGEKTRYLPLHPGTNALIHDYLDVADHTDDAATPTSLPPGSMITARHGRRTVRHLR
jgi:site-specific recombinase XerC